MAIQLNNLKVNTKARKKKKRLGRGNASGWGTYAGRGLKGQRSRSGGKKGLKLKGFKKNLLNLPKYKGIKSFQPTPQEVSLGQLNKKFSDGDKITPQLLLEQRIIDTLKAPVKILANGDLTIKLEVAGCQASKAAQKAIEKAGGKIVLAKESESKKAIKKETDKKVL